MHAIHGSFGKIFCIEKNKKKFAVKFIKMNKLNASNLNYVLREIIFTKMASALKIGPTFYPLSGYDCIIYEDGIEFVMEKCEDSDCMEKIRH